jgi:hypothetical protein
MAMKDFDFKQFLLKKGEWVVLGVALAIVIPLLFSGLKNVLFSGSPTKNADVLADLSRSAGQRIDASRPPPGTDAEPEEITKLSVVSFEPINLEPYRTSIEWFRVGTLEDSKRRNPDVLAPAEFQVDVVRAGVKGIIFGDKKGSKVYVLQSKALLTGVLDKRRKRFLRSQQTMGPGARGGVGEGMMGTGGGLGGGGDGRGAPAPGPGARPGPGTGQVIRVELMDVDKVKDDTQLAEQIYPAQIVVVSASFPLRQQLEEFRRALRKKSLTELLAMFNSGDATWQFLPLEIQRRELAADGKPKTDWEPYTKKIVERLQEYLLVAAGPEEEDKELLDAGMIPPGLVLARPPLAPEGRAKYPDVNLPGIKDTLEELKKVGAEDPDKRAKSSLQERVERKNKGGFNVWDPQNLMGQDDDEKKVEQPPKTPGDGENKPKDKDPAADPDADLVLPKNVLVRFLDTSVKPGAIYEYRLKIRMANPNYQKTNVAYQKLAETKEIEAANWTVVPKVTVPNESVWYVAEEKADKEKTQVQVHDWIGVYTDPVNRESEIRVGDWTVLEKQPAYRGEYIGRTAEADVAIWRTETAGYELASLVKGKGQHRRIPVDFTVRASNAQEPNLLVDFEGGKGTSIRIETRTPEGKLVFRTVSDDAPVQLLVLTPDGKLVVRNSADDLENEERKNRLSAWKEWVDAVKSGKKSPNSNRPDEMFNKGGGGGKPGGN